MRTYRYRVEGVNGRKQSWVHEGVVRCELGEVLHLALKDYMDQIIVSDSLAGPYIVHRALVEKVDQ